MAGIRKPCGCADPLRCRRCQMRRATAKYKRTARGKQINAAYGKSEKGRAVYARHRKTERRRQAAERYRLSEKGRLKYATELHIGNRYVGRAQTPEQAQMIRQHIKERLSAFRQLQRRTPCHYPVTPAPKKS